jgi:hypothetical protein
MKGRKTLPQDPPAVKPVASRYTDCAIPAPDFHCYYYIFLYYALEGKNAQEAVY